MTEITAAMSVHGEAELNQLIERRCSTREPDPVEHEELWRESVRRYNARLQEERRAELCSYHRDQAARLRAVLESLIVGHEEAAAALEDA